MCKIFLVDVFAINRDRINSFPFQIIDLLKCIWNYRGEGDKKEIIVAIDVIEQ